MFSKWFSDQSLLKVGFDDVKLAIQNPDNHIVINTMNSDNQGCLIKNTIDIQLEERVINELLQKQLFNDKRFIIYGKNATDNTAEKKYKQLVSLGFQHVYIYSGGMFEWSLLQDIYGTEEFPTTKIVADILRCKPPLITFGRIPLLTHY